MGEQTGLENLAAAAVEAASKVLSDAGLRDFEVVVNVAWLDPSDNEYAMGTAASSRLPMLADSLRQSAEEVEGA